MDKSKKTALYRLINEAGEVIYVGIAFDPRTRFWVHAKKPWWPEVAHKVIEWFPDRDAARTAERDEIRRSSPRYNIVDTERFDTKAHIAASYIRQIREAGYRRRHVIMSELTWADFDFVCGGSRYRGSDQIERFIEQKIASYRRRHPGVVLPSDTARAGKPGSTASEG